MEITRFDPQVVEVLPSRAAAEEAALVLQAIDVASRVEQHPGGWALIVRAADIERATATLAAYGAERAAPRAAPAPISTRRGGTIAGLAAAVLLLIFFVVLNTWLPAPEWAARGSAAGARILRGEWWRVVTALTLHADLSHVANNVVACALFATGVCRWFGPGVGLWLILAAGAGGNALNALLRDPDHTAVGASTAVFGAVGILTAVQVTRRLGTGAKGGLMRMRVWAPAAAGLALLAFLGSSERSDVVAHLFGFAVGTALGFAASHLRAERVPTWLQVPLAIGVGATVWACWRLALSR